MIDPCMLREVVTKCQVNISFDYIPRLMTKKEKHLVFKINAAQVIGGVINLSQIGAKSLFKFTNLWRSFLLLLLAYFSSFLLCILIYYFHVWTHFLIMVNIFDLSFCPNFPLFSSTFFYFLFTPFCLNFENLNLS